MIVAGVWTGVGLSNLKNSQTPVRSRIQTFWNRSGVGVWKSDSGHLWELAYIDLPEIENKTVECLPNT